VYSQCWQAHLVVVPWKCWYLVKMPILPRLDEEDEVEVARVILESQTHVYNSWAEALEIQRTLNPRMVESLQWLYAKKIITEALTEFVVTAEKDGAIHPNHAGAIIHPLQNEIASCLRSIQQVTDGHHLMNRKLFPHGLVKLSHVGCRLEMMDLGDFEINDSSQPQVSVSTEGSSEARVEVADNVSPPGSNQEKEGDSKDDSGSRPSVVEEERRFDKQSSVLTTATTHTATGKKKPMKKTQKKETSKGVSNPEIIGKETTQKPLRAQKSTKAKSPSAKPGDS